MGGTRRAQPRGLSQHPKWGQLIKQTGSWAQTVQAEREQTGAAIELSSERSFSLRGDEHRTVEPQ